VNPLSKADKKVVEHCEEQKKDIPANLQSQFVDNQQFMRVAGCNRKVQDLNDRPLFRIDLDVD